MEDWQLKLDRINERGKHLLETGLWSDCQFNVGDGKYKKSSNEKWCELWGIVCVHPFYQSAIYHYSSNLAYPLPGHRLPPKSWKPPGAYTRLETTVLEPANTLGDFLQLKFMTHKMILSMSSPVFEAMFYGGLAEGNGPITIPDVQADAFTSMLDYIYADEVNLTTIEQACELCYAAKKYMLPSLVNQCMGFIWKDVSYPMAFRAYEFAKLFDEADLMQRCMEIISLQTNLVLNDQSFEEVEHSTLLAILDSEKLNINSELEIICAVYKWAVKECNRKGIDLKKLENLRSVIGGAMSKIRFLTLTPAEFAACPVIPELLTQEEAFALLMKISSPSTVVTVPDGFSASTVARANIALQTIPADQLFCCERTIVAQVPIKNYSRMDSSVTFTLDRDIVLHGIMIPSQLKMPFDSDERRSVPQDNQSREEGLSSASKEMETAASYKESVRVSLMDARGRQISMALFDKRVSYKQLIDIKLRELARLYANTTYKLGVEMCKRGWYPMGTYSKHTNVCANVLFTFCVGDPAESFRDCMIRSLQFSLPGAPPGCAGDEEVSHCDVI